MLKVNQFETMITQSAKGYEHIKYLLAKKLSHGSRLLLEASQQSIVPKSNWTRRDTRILLSTPSASDLLTLRNVQGLLTFTL